jgi:hypothetical protein
VVAIQIPANTAINPTTKLSVIGSLTSTAASSLQIGLGIQVRQLQPIVLDALVQFLQRGHWQLQRRIAAT